MIIGERGAVRLTFVVGQTITRRPVTIFVRQAVCNIALSEVLIKVIRQRHKL